MTGVSLTKRSETMAKKCFLLRSVAHFILEILQNTSSGSNWGRSITQMIQNFRYLNMFRRYRRWRQYICISVLFINVEFNNSMLILILFSGVHYQKQDDQQYTVGAKSYKCGIQLRQTLGPLFCVQCTYQDNRLFLWPRYIGYDYEQIFNKKPNVHESALYWLGWCVQKC